MIVTANFQYLMFLNYIVDRSLLELRVPNGVQLQLLNGKAYVSIVAFLFHDLHLSGLPAPFHQEFEEVNLRFYVKQGSGQAEKKGVVFLREIVPKSLLAAAARVLFQEKYISLPMSHHVQVSANQINTLEYRWQSEKQESYIRGVFENQWTFPERNSVEFFFVDRPFGFTRIDQDNTRQLTMEHPLWRVTPLMDVIAEYEIPDIFGMEFVPYLTLKPASAFVAEGSAIMLKA